MLSKLSWDDPYLVPEKFGPVNSRIQDEKQKYRPRVVHINNLKCFKETYVHLITAAKSDTINKTKQNKRSSKWV